MDLIISVVFLISYIIIFLFQKNIIKGQTALNKTLTDKLVVLEKFQNIFDLEKLEKYVKLIQDTHEEDLKQAYTERTSDLVKALVLNAYKNIPSEINENYLELVGMMYRTMMQFEPETREIMILHMPKNEVLLRELMVSGQIPHKP